MLKYHNIRSLYLEYRLVGTQKDLITTTMKKKKKEFFILRMMMQKLEKDLVECLIQFEITVHDLISCFCNIKIKYFKMLSQQKILWKFINWCERKQVPLWWPIAKQTRGEAFIVLFSEQTNCIFSKIYWCICHVKNQWQILKKYSYVWRICLL